MTKAELLNELASKQVSISFTKKDGSNRTMLCTRSIELIPVEHLPKNEIQDVTEETDNIRVFDIEAQGWRSFNFSSIKAN